MAEEGKSLGQLVEHLQNEYGRHYFGRRDLHIADELKLSALSRAAERPPRSDTRCCAWKTWTATSSSSTFPRTTTGPSHGCCCAVPEPSRCCASTAKPPTRSWSTRFSRPPSRSSIARQPWRDVMVSRVPPALGLTRGSSSLPLVDLFPV